MTEAERLAIEGLLDRLNSWEPGRFHSSDAIELYEILHVAGFELKTEKVQGPATLAPRGCDACAKGLRTFWSCLG